MARSRSRGRRDRRSRDRRSRSRSRRRDRDRDRDEKTLQQREAEQSAIRIENEVQRRIAERLDSADFEAALQEKLDAELERHFSLLVVEYEMKKKKMVEDFRHHTETEERSKQELEEIIRINQLKAQEQQQKVAAALSSQEEDLLRERDMFQKLNDQRRRKAMGTRKGYAPLVS